MSQPESEIQPQTVRAMIQTACDAWMQGNAAAFASLFAPEAEFVVPGQIYRGLAQIESVASEFAATHTDVQIQIQQIIVEGNQAAVEWHWEDTETATGKRTVADDAIVVSFQNGQIQRWREYIDERD